MAQLGVRRRHTATATQEAAVLDKLYFRIGEVANLCGLPAYVLRFWESEFPQLRPNKGGTGQRLYRQRDVRMVLRIKELLYEGGVTIPGARQALAAEQRGQKPQLTLGIAEAEAEAGQPDRKVLRRLRGELAELLEALGGVPATGVASVAKGQPVRTGRSRMEPAAMSQDLFE